MKMKLKVDVVDPNADKAKDEALKELMRQGRRAGKVLHDVDTKCKKVRGGKFKATATAYVVI
jgi:hypothetical protein